MPTKIEGPAFVQRGRGRQVCTIADFTTHDNDMKFGPDGLKWEVFSHDEAQILMADEKITYSHNSVSAISHLCAAKSSWAFAVPGLDVLPAGVCFLYIKPPSSLSGLASGGGHTKKYTGANLSEGYTKARAAWQSTIWRRIHTNGAIEIAINFCLK